MKIELSGNLLRFTDYKKVFQFHAETANDGIRSLVDEYPAIKTVLTDSSGNLRKVHLAFLNGAKISHDQLSREVNTDDELLITTAIAGG